jgi:hypothetical protein
MLFAILPAVLFAVLPAVLFAVLLAALLCCAAESEYASAHASAPACMMMQS